MPLGRLMVSSINILSPLENFRADAVNEIIRGIENYVQRAERKVRYRLKEHSHIFTNEKIDEQELRFTVARIGRASDRERLQLDENGSKNN